jgi:hypothetical protein
MIFQTHPRADLKPKLTTTQESKIGIFPYCQPFALHKMVLAWDLTIHTIAPQDKCSNEQKTKVTQNLLDLF